MSSDSSGGSNQQSDRPSAVTRRAGILHRVADDLRRGHNVELYLTVTLSLCVAALGVFSVVNINVIGAATLAVLALLAASGLETRHQSAEIGKRLERLEVEVNGDVPADRFLTTRRPSLEVDVAAAADIRLVGVTLSRTVRDLLPVLDRRLRKGASIRVLVIDGDGPARAEAVTRARGAGSSDFYQHRLAATTDLLRVLAAAAPTESALQLRVLPYVPTFGMCLIDPAEAHGRIYVEIYQHRTLEHCPKFSLRADRDGPWYQHFARQFETLWDSASPHRLSIPELHMNENKVGPNTLSPA
jgi:hypothetical protein